VYIKAIGVEVPPTVSLRTAREQGWYPGDDEIPAETAAAVAGDTPAPELALAAARIAFERGGHNPTDIDLLTYSGAWHQGPDGWLPQAYLQRLLVGGDCLAVRIEQGCNGMFASLELGAAYLAADPQRKAALAVAADNFGTPLIDRWNGGQGFIMGDAGSAVLLSREEGFAKLLSVTSVTVPEGEELHRAGEEMFPPGATVGRPVDLAARGEEFRRRLTASPTGMALWLEVQKRMVEVVHIALAEAGIGTADITRMAFTTFPKEGVEAPCLAALGLTPQHSTSAYGQTVGHVGASDQILAIDHLLGTGELKAGDHVVLHGMGPGITLSCAVVQILATPPWLG
jgi:3-oxoacyl-[acyl-carrier-protein] synthase-3/clorobiocin biosynthesis protein CloN2